MLVKDCMCRRLVTIGPDQSLADASRLMKEHNIGRLPVLKDGRLVGIVSDRDIKGAGPSCATALEIHELKYLLEKIKVGDIMIPNPLTIGEERTLGEAAFILQKHKISGLPVVDDSGNVTGVLSRGDVLRFLASSTGITTEAMQPLWVRPGPGSKGGPLSSSSNTGGEGDYPRPQCIP